ncbi:MAG: UDP-N-acetylmuramate--L-alanine ligase [Campylobacterales bacterium]
MKIHFIGIGGIGISAIARFMAHEGHEVSGSDVAHSPMVEKLEHENIRINVPHDASVIADHDLVIHSAIIKPDNVEVVAAKAKNIPVLHRRDALKLMLSEKEVFAVGGAHGKSTTTAILATILDATALIGAEAKNFGSNVRFKGGKTVVFEADESDASFLQSNPYCALVTNAEPEHMEYYDYDLDKFYGAYREFLGMAKIRVINAEDPFLGKYEGDAIRLYAARDIQNLRYEVIEGEPFTCFTLRDLGEFCVWGFGEHIALDAALAVLAAMDKLDVETIRQRIQNYRGIKKRFDVLKREADFVLIDDYAHHPTEIEATLNAAKTYAKLLGLSKVTAIWQPHKYSRTVHNLDRFVECFAGVDRLVILPVWAAGEAPVELDFKTLFARYNPVLAPDYKTAKTLCDLSSGLVIGFGAGDITYQLRNALKTN